MESVIKIFFLLLPCCEIWHLTPPLVLRMINWKQNHKINFCPLRRDLHNEGETALNREIRKNTNKRIYRKVQMSLSCYKGNFYFYSWQGDQWIKPAEAFNNLFWSCDFQQGKEPLQLFSTARQRVIINIILFWQRIANLPQIDVNLKLNNWKPSLCMQKHQWQQRLIKILFNLNCGILF